LFCALIVWTIYGVEDLVNIGLSNTFLTELECQKQLEIERTENSNFQCILIDKRINFSKEEWASDNCSKSEHEWLGTVIEK
jgi:hypothetical protein